MTTESIIIPDWSAPARVKAISTTRLGGQSQAPYNSLNLAQHVGDEGETVNINRALLKQIAGYTGEPLWLQQVHGRAVVDTNTVNRLADADASFTTVTNTICAVMTADCLPVLFCDKQGQAVAAAHAGWRGLAAGVLEASLQRLCDALSCPPSQIIAWLGPAIGPQAFEVGGEVREAFIAEHDVSSAFIKTSENHWLMDIYAVARERLSVVGVQDISGGQYCTFSDKQQFFSYRRDGVCGRMATLIWLQDE